MSNQLSPISKDRLAALIEAARLKRDALATATGEIKSLDNETLNHEIHTSSQTVTYDRYGNLISYNSKQQEFLNLALAGKSCVLIGSAGTGKTTCMRGVTESLIAARKVSPLKGGHKHLIQGSPGIVIISYTRRAVSNIKRVLSEDLKNNAITYHKLMEYEPVFYEVTDPETGDTKNTMKFEPARSPYNPLDSAISTIIVEEASMLSVEYHSLLIGALHSGVQVIYLGDIYQLPPVFGSAILGYKLNELPVVELTEVYRQALNSPIISYAHKIKNGQGFSIPEKTEIITEDGKVTLHPWKKKICADDALTVAAKFFAQSYDAGTYNPDEDMILIPFNKAYGTIELNKYIANHIAKKAKSVVWEIIAGWNKHYLRVGEKVMYDKEDATVIKIVRNGTYIGARTQKESPLLDYWGAETEEETHVSHLEETEGDNGFDVDAILASLSATAGEGEDRVHSASHHVTVQLVDTGREITLTTAAEINSLLLGYVLTVHKAQGSEWEKVYLLFHHSHATMLSRELLYTAFTRAKKEVYCICDKDTFIKGVASQRIKGTTLVEKSEYFKGRV